jgi:hypothetical protein
VKYRRHVQVVAVAVEDVQQVEGAAVQFTVITRSKFRWIPPRPRKRRAKRLS